jgi:hypothetical protein
LLLGSIILGYFFLYETHPDMQPWSTEADLATTSAETPLMPTQGSTAHAAANLATESYGTFDTVNVEEEEVWRVKPNGRPASIDSASSDKVFTRKVIMLVVALGIFCTHCMQYDVLLPVFLQDEWNSDPEAPFAGGLGLSTQTVGIIMSVNGFIALFVQAVIFPLMASWFGIYKLFVICAVGQPLAYFVVPYLAVIPKEWVFTGIYACLTVRNIFQIIAYPVILIMLKEASPSPNCLGKINGLAASTGAACRMVGSPVAGYLYGLGSRLDFTALAWWASAVIALLGTAQVPFVERTKNKTAHVGPAAPCRLIPAGTPENEQKEQVVHITIEDMESPNDSEVEA